MFITEPSYYLEYSNIQQHCNRFRILQALAWASFPARYVLNHHLCLSVIFWHLWIRTTGKGLNISMIQAWFRLSSPYCSLLFRFPLYLPTCSRNEVLLFLKHFLEFINFFVKLWDIFGLDNQLELEGLLQLGWGNLTQDLEKDKSIRDILNCDDPNYEDLVKRIQSMSIIQAMTWWIPGLSLRVEM